MKLIKKLLNTKMKFAKNQKGLTLIELLVVIVILGIIAAIAIPLISSQTDKAKNASAAQTVSIIEDAYSRAQAEGKNYTTVKELSDNGYIRELPANMDCSGVPGKVTCTAKEPS